MKKNLEIIDFQNDSMIILDLLLDENISIDEIVYLNDRINNETLKPTTLYSYKKWLFIAFKNKKDKRKDIIYSELEKLEEKHNLNY